jgi:CO/xanthine dehydrogenase FAD-binding subunit
MRSDVAQFDLSAPPSLDAVLAQLAAEPGKHTPIAGGTELMVALNTGRLTQHSLVSIHHLKELRFIRADRTRSTSARARPLPTSAAAPRSPPIFRC